MKKKAFKGGLEGLKIGAATGALFGALSPAFSDSTGLYKSAINMATKTLGLSENSLLYTAKAIGRVAIAYSKLSETPHPESRTKYTERGGTIQGDTPQLFLKKNSQDTNGASSSNDDKEKKRDKNGELNPPIRSFAANIAYMSFFSKQSAF